MKNYHWIGQGCSSACFKILCYYFLTQFRLKSVAKLTVLLL
jgi:hypothetical protein